MDWTAFEIITIVFTLMAVALVMAMSGDEKIWLDQDE